MPTYAYDCPRCGRFDAVRPIASADCALDCRSCGRPATRVFAAPAFHPASPLHRALDAQRRSAHEPDVVTSVPPARGGASGPRDPRHALLPRP